MAVYIALPPLKVKYWDQENHGWHKRRCFLSPQQDGRLKEETEAMAHRQTICVNIVVLVAVTLCAVVTANVPVCLRDGLCPDTDGSFACKAEEEGFRTYTNCEALKVHYQRWEAVSKVFREMTNLLVATGHLAKELANVTSIQHKEVLE